jgi:hypothetical protein
MSFCGAREANASEAVTCSAHSHMWTLAVLSASARASEFRVGAMKAKLKSQLKVPVSERALIYDDAARSPIG